MPTAKTLDKTTLQIIFYFIEKLNGVLGKTHLQKMLFLSDLLSTQKFKEKLTVLEYRKYRYGPYSEVIKGYISELKTKGAIEEKEFPLSGGNNTYTRYYKKANLSVKDKLLASIGAEKVLLLDDVINSYGNMSLQNVLDVVYRLEVVKNTSKNKPLNIAKKSASVNDEPSDEIDIF